MSKSLLVALVLVATWIAPVHGAPLGPKKPSQLVTLQPDPFFGTAPCSGVESPLTQVLQADLSTSTLVIPPGEVLVIQGGTWQLTAFGNPASRDASLRIFLKDGTNQNAVMFGSGAVTDSGGRASGSFRLDPGILVRPGQTLCSVFDVAGDQKGGTVFAYGYLTKDK